MVTSGVILNNTAGQWRAYRRNNQWNHYWEIERAHRTRPSKDDYSKVSAVPEQGRDTMPCAAETEGQPLSVPQRKRKNNIAQLQESKLTAELYSKKMQSAFL